MSEKDTDALLRLLYDEEITEAERARVLADEELAGQLESFRGLRSLMREAPDEEPPAAVSQKLLAAAATSAPRARPAPAEEGGGLLDRLLSIFRPIAAYPGLAAAASLVLVAGVFGTLYMTGKSEMATPVDRTSAVAGDELERADDSFADESSLLAPEPAPELGLPSPGEGSEEPAADPSPAPSREGRARGAVDEKPARAPPARPRPRDARRQKAAPDFAPPAAVGGGVSDTGPFEAEREIVPRGATRSGDSPPPARDRGAAEVRQEQAPAAPARRAPAPAPESAPAPPAEADADDDAAGSGAAPAEDVRRLHARAAELAGAGKCADARSLVNRIRSLDGGYYDRVVREDRRLAACLGTAK